MTQFGEAIREEKLRAAASRYFAKNRRFKCGDWVRLCFDRGEIKENQLGVVVIVWGSELEVLTWTGEAINTIIVQSWEVVHEPQ